MPPGLPAALESLARAVLKEQPTDLPNFAAAHFRVLLAERTGLCIFLWPDKKKLVELIWLIHLIQY